MYLSLSGNHHHPIISRRFTQPTSFSSSCSSTSVPRLLRATHAASTSATSTASDSFFPPISALPFSRRLWSPTLPTVSARASTPRISGSVRLTAGTTTSCTFSRHLPRSFSHPREQRTPSSDHLQRWYKELLARAQLEGIVLDVTTLAEEYLAGNFHRPMDDSAVISVPRFCDDHWVKETEDQCQRRLTAGTLPPTPEEVEKKRGKKGGELVASLAASLKDIRVRLLVVKLQHQCAECGQFLREVTHFMIPAGKSENGKNKKKDRYFCRGCFGRLGEEFQRSGIVVEGKPVDLRERNELTVCRLFESRQFFMTTCQCWHYQFDQVGMLMSCHVDSKSHLQHQYDPLSLLQPADPRRDPYVQQCRHRRILSFLVS